MGFFVGNLLGESTPDWNVGTSGTHESAGR
jgi:hypothetical protein